LHKYKKKQKLDKAFDKDVTFDIYVFLLHFILRIDKLHKIEIYSLYNVKMSIN